MYSISALILQNPYRIYQIKIILNAKKVLLFHHEEPWIEKNGEEDFNFPMGSYDGAEVCQLVSTFIFTKKSRIMQEQNKIGLYRDDGLGIFGNFS